MRGCADIYRDNQLKAANRKVNGMEATRRAQQAQQEAAAAKEEAAAAREKAAHLEVRAPCDCCCIVGVLS